MSNLDLTIAEIMHGDTEVLKIMKGDKQKWPYLPYDAEVEYLRSTPTAKIKTGLTDVDKIEIKFRISAFSAYAAIFGNYVGENHNVWRIICGGNSSDTNMILCMNTKANGGGTRIPTGARGVDHTLIASLTEVIADGEPVSDIATTTGTSINNEIVLFARDKNQTSIPELYTRIYYFKAWKNGVLLRDYIPVRVESVGYMYDRASGQLFGNAGSGTFICGNDV